MNAITPASTASLPVPSSSAAARSSFMTPGNMAEAIALAKFISQCKNMPEHLKGSPADCLMIIEQAARWNMSPYAAAMSSVMVKGKMTFEGKFVAAALTSSRVLDGHLEYEYSGEGVERTVRVTGRLRGETLIREISVTLKNVKTTNEWWGKLPDQMLGYNGARQWARRHAPGVMLGVYSPDEFDAEADAPFDPYEGTTIDGSAQAAFSAVDTQLTAGPNLAASAASKASAMPELEPAPTPAEIEAARVHKLVSNVVKRLAELSDCVVVNTAIVHCDDVIFPRIRAANLPELGKALSDAIAAARVKCPAPKEAEVLDNTGEDDAGEPEQDPDEAEMDRLFQTTPRVSNQGRLASLGLDRNGRYPDGTEPDYSRPEFNRTNIDGVIE